VIWVFYGNEERRKDEEQITQKAKRGVELAEDILEQRGMCVVEIRDTWHQLAT
jgi:uncharacterized membrane protein